MEPKLKLYRVTVEFETVILSKDEKEAEAAATRIVKENDEDANLVSAREMKNKDDLPPEWDEYCLPWPSQQKYAEGDDKAIYKFFEERD